MQMLVLIIARELGLLGCPVIATPSKSIVYLRMAGIQGVAVYLYLGRLATIGKAGRRHDLIG